MEQATILAVVGMLCVTQVICFVIWAVTIDSVVTSLAPQYEDDEDDDEE